MRSNSRIVGSGLFVMALLALVLFPGCSGCSRSGTTKEKVETTTTTSAKAPTLSIQDVETLQVPAPSKAPPEPRRVYSDKGVEVTSAHQGSRVTVTIDLGAQPGSK